MAVVINEFEVVSEAAPARPESRGESGRETGSAQATELEPATLTRVLRLRELSMLRVWAH
jgi:hypothetical protein